MLLIAWKRMVGRQIDKVKQIENSVVNCSLWTPVGLKSFLLPLLTVGSEPGHSAALESLLVLAFHGSESFSCLFWKYFCKLSRLPDPSFHLQAPKFERNGGCLVASAAGSCGSAPVGSATRL